MIEPAEAAGMLARLEAVADKLGVRVRYEPLATDDEAVSIRGGLCRVRGDRMILIDSRLAVAERCLCLAEALGGFDLSRIFLPPAVRALVEERRGGR
jgi:hypothetical protein